MKCPNCDYDCPPEMRFCGMCGAALTRACSECSFINPINYRFCGMCGAALTPQDPAPVRSRAAAPRPSTPAAVTPRPTSKPPPPPPTPPPPPPPPPPPDFEAARRRPHAPAARPRRARWRKAHCHHCLCRRKRLHRTA